MPSALQEVPWIASLKDIASPSLRVHQELVELGRYLTPLAEERAAREAAVERVTAVVRSVWPSASVRLFGSFAMGLYLPTSDIDAVVIGSGQKDRVLALRALASALGRAGVAQKLEVIAKAKVPIIKFEESASGCRFDVSFDVANGVQAAEAIKGFLAQLPPMRHLVVLLKIFLLQRGLNEVYQGGLGSYGLLIAVAGFLLTHPSRIGPYDSVGRGARAPPRPLETNLGLLLADFFQLYGKNLNVQDVAVCCSKGGRFMDKESINFFNSYRPNLLALEDPCDKTNDVGANSYEIGKVREAFEFAYRELIRPAQPGESILKRIIRLEPALFDRNPPPPPDAQPGKAPDEAPPSKGKPAKIPAGMSVPVSSTVRTGV